MRCIYYIFYVASMIFMITSCAGHVDEYNGEVIKYQFAKEKKIDNIEDLIMGIEVIELKESKESYVTPLCDIIPCENEYVVVNIADGRIMRFNSSGDFINSIGERGRAKNEFLNISGVTIDGKRVNVYSNANNTILNYDIDGTFIDSKKMATQAQYYLKVDGGYYGYLGYDNGQMPYRLVKTSRLGEVKDKLLPSDAKIICFVEQSAPLLQYNGEVYVRETYSSRIHKINSKGEADVLFAFDFVNYNIPSQCFTQSDAFAAATKMMESDFATIGNFLTNQKINIVNVIYQMTSENQKMYSVVGLQRNGNWQWITSTEDGVNSIFFCSIRHLTTNNELIALTTRGGLQAFKNNYDTPISGLESIDGDNDTPVIIRIKLNE